MINTYAVLGQAGQVIQIVVDATVTPGYSWVDITTHPERTLIVSQPNNYTYGGGVFHYVPIYQPGKYYKLQDGIWVPDSVALQSARDASWAGIKARRESHKVGGVYIASVNKWFHTDTDSRVQQLGLVIMGAGIPPNLQWKTLDGSFTLMTPSLAGQIFTGVAILDTTAFSVAEMHRQAMLVSQDPANYDYTNGWPATFGG